MEKTGEEFCEGSPYQSVADVYDDMVEHSELRKDERYIKQLKERAEQELAFLKSLLPT